MKVLSLFDGMSCGQIALKEHGFIVDKYYASEIDKYAIKQTQLNFPETIQLGSVTEWRTWNIDWSSINLICAGSPCQGFSFAGKQFTFDDPRSKLFFVFVEILNHCKKFNPEVRFLLENVDMKKDYLRIISEYVGIFPTKINSALVSAQNRERWYWSNIRTKQIGLFDELYTDIPQPIDEGILGKNILQSESEIDKKHYFSKQGYETLKSILKRSKDKGHGFRSGIIKPPYDEKINCLYANYHKGCDGKRTMVLQLNPSLESGGKQPYQQNRVYDVEGKFPALMAELSSESNLIYYENILRKLTPIECARLQTIPDWYKWECSDSQIYRMLGNGWTIKVIKHIISYL